MFEIKITQRLKADLKISIGSYSQMDPIGVVDERSPVQDIRLSSPSLHTPSSLIQENAQAFLASKDIQDRTTTAFLRYEAPFSPQKLRESAPLWIERFPYIEVVLLLVHRSSTKNYGRGHAIIPSHMEAMLWKNLLD